MGQKNLLELSLGLVESSCQFGEILLHNPLFENLGLVVVWNKKFSEFRKVIGTYKTFYLKLPKESRLAPIIKYTNICVMNI